MSPPPPPPRNFFEKIASHMYPVHISSRSSLAKRGGWCAPNFCNQTAPFLGRGVGVGEKEEHGEHDKLDLKTLEAAAGGGQVCLRLTPLPLPHPPQRDRAETEAKIRRPKAGNEQ